MAFSLRSFFGKGGSESTAPADPAAGMPGSNDPQGASPFSAVAPAPGSTPFSNNLFKTAGPSEPLGQPVASAMLSPFSPAPVSQPGITIGDLLSLLPPDVAKNPGLPATHPVAIPEAVLEHALRSGRPVLPLFEVYRACPAMFQTPVGPQDVREVPLPAHKLAQLLPQRAPELVGAGSPGLGSLPPSPFGASPFMSGAQTATTASSPFAVASAAVAEPPAMGNPAASTTLFHPSPFTTAMMPEAKPAAAPGGGGFTPASSPFTAMANPFVSAPVVTASSPFSRAPAPAAPVETPPAPAAVAPSPFGTFAPAPAPAPASEPMPLGSLFGQAPGATEPSAPSPFTQSFGAPAPAGGGFGMPPAAASPFGTPLAQSDLLQVPSASRPPPPPFQASPFSPSPQRAPEFHPPANVSPFAALPEAPAPAVDPMKGLFGGPPAPSPFSAVPPSPMPSQPAAAAPQPFQMFGASPEAPAAPTMPPASSFFPATPAQASPLPPSLGTMFPGPPAELPPATPPAAAAPVADLPDNPFARIQAMMAKGMPPSPVPAPLATPSMPPASAATLPEHMFAKAPIAGTGAEPFPLPQSFMADLARLTGYSFPDAPPGIEPPAKPPIAAVPAGSFSMSLAAALKNCAPHDLGTVPENIQSWVRFTVPMEKIQSQLAAGRVRLPLDEILAGTDPEVRRMFAAARAGLIVDLEMNAVFHALSEGSAAALPPAATPVAEIKPAASPLPPVASPPAPAPESFVLPPQESFFKAPEPAVAPPAPAAPTPEPAGMGSPFWGDAANSGPPVSSFMLEPEEPRKPVSPFPAFQAEVSPAPLAPTLPKPPSRCRSHLRRLHLLNPW